MSMNHMICTIIICCVSILDTIASPIILARYHHKHPNKDIILEAPCNITSSHTCDYSYLLDKPLLSNKTELNYLVSQRINHFFKDKNKNDDYNYKTQENMILMNEEWDTNPYTFPKPLKKAVKYRWYPGYKLVMYGYDTLKYIFDEMKIRAKNEYNVSIVLKTFLDEERLCYPTCNKWIQYQTQFSQYKDENNNKNKNKHNNNDNNNNNNNDNENKKEESTTEEFDSFGKRYDEPKYWESFLEEVIVSECKCTQNINPPTLTKKYFQEMILGPLHESSSKAMQLYTNYKNGNSKFNIVIINSNNRLQSFEKVCDYLSWKWFNDSTWEYCEGGRGFNLGLETFNCWIRSPK